MTDGPDPERLDALEKRLAAAKKGQEPEPREESHISQAQHGWRMMTELVAGLLLGFGIGYGTDRLAGTLPWFMITFTILGFIAGVRTMMRTAQEVQNKNSKLDAANIPAGQDEMYDDD